MRIARIGIGFAVAILFAVLLVRNVDLVEALRAAQLVPLHVVAASVALVLAGYSMRAWRWQLMLGGAGVQASYGQAASTFFAAFALNNVLPLRAGDIYRCVVASRFQDGTIAKSLASLLTERLLDLAALTIVLIVLFLFLPNARLQPISFPITAVLILGLSVLGSLIAFPVAARRLVNDVVHGLERFPIFVKVAACIERFSAAIEGTLSRDGLAMYLGITALAWSLEVGVFVLVGSALDGELRLSGGLSAGALGTLATLVPGAPGHLGTFDFFSAEGFRYGGLSTESAVVAAVLCHIVIVVPVTLYGGIRLIIDRQSNV